jgi:hypothetical protein
MKTQLTQLATALSILAVSSIAHAQAWVKPPGESYVKVTAGTFQSDANIDLQGNIDDAPFLYENSSVGIYAEVGLIPRLALSLDTSFFRAINTVEERTRYINTGAGDLGIGLHTPLWRGQRCTSSASLRGVVPLYSGVIEPGTEVGGIGVTGADRFTPALGDGSFDIIPSANFGCGIPEIRGWASVSAGYQVRLRGFGDGVVYGGNIGSFVWPERLALTAFLSGVQRFSDDAERPTKSFVSFGGGLILRVWGPFSLEAAANYMPTGAFIARGWGANAGVSYNGSLW